MAKRRRLGPSKESVRCFYCGEEIVGDELRCPHCRKVFREGKMWAAAFVVVLLVAATLAYLFLISPQGPAGSGAGTQASYAVSLSVPTNIHDAEPGGDTGFTLIITSSGSVLDTISIETETPTPQWIARYDFPTIALNPGTRGVRILTVIVPSDAALGTYDLTVSVRSRGDPTKVVSRGLTVKVVALDPRTAALDNRVQVDYTLWLTNGVEKDSSIPRGQPLKVYLGPQDPDTTDEYTQVIEGFWESITGMRVGETNVVRIPPEKAYSSGELAGQTLIFEIELVSIDG